MRVDISRAVVQEGLLPDSLLLCQHIFVAQGEVSGHRSFATRQPLEKRHLAVVFVDGSKRVR